MQWPESRFSEVRIQDYAASLRHRDALRARPRDDGRTAEGHEPIYPMLEERPHPPNLAGKELDLFQLIVRHFLAQFLRDAKIEEERIIMDMPFKGTFNIRRRRMIDRGWLEVLPLVEDLGETNASFQVGQELHVTHARILEMPQVSCELSAAEYVRQMADHGIGTASTIPQCVSDLEKLGLIRYKTVPRDHVKEEPTASNMLAFEKEALCVESDMRSSDGSGITHGNWSCRQCGGK